MSNPTELAQFKSKIASKLEKILPYVDNPARYIGGEANGVQKDFDKMVGSIALMFPDTYELGMSNNGTRILYHVVNGHDDLLAEQGFTPWTDMAEQMKNHDLPLYTHESYRPIKDFDLVGITLQTELNYTNVPYMLDLAGIPIWSAERGIDDPFIIGGGPCMANPEPVADFYDIFVIGDGEILAPQIVRMVGEGRRQKKSREEILTELTALTGVYIPALMAFEVGPEGEYIPVAEAKGPYLKSKAIKRTWIEVLNKDNYPIQNLIPNTKLVHERFAVEVMRGCTQGCRFCQAGYWYRPNRELNPDHVVEIAEKGLKATGEKELSLLSLSTADYSQVEKVTDKLIDSEVFDNVDVSLPSLRANSFGQNLAAKVAAIKGGRSATFAPETGSERLRHMINKTISDQEMYEAAHNVFSMGFNKIKLYTMVGLPTENIEDMEAFCGLIQGLVDIGKEYGPNNQVHASVGIMVPKPFTPMQWVGFMPKEKTMDHIHFVRRKFYKNKNVRISWTDWNEAHLESFYSRGDRALAPMIYEAFEKGMVFESHGETQNYNAWTEIWEKYGYNQDRIFNERSFDEVFPWDFIHAGVTKGYLKNEYKKMHLKASEPVPDCKWGKESCQTCGVPGNYLDTQLATEPENPAPNKSIDEIKAMRQAKKEAEIISYRYRVVFQKEGLSRFLPHQNTMGFIVRAFARLDYAIAYSQGFSPKPKMANQGALPLGLSTYCDEVSVDLLRECPLTGAEYESLLVELNKIFPQGMAITLVERIEQGKLPKPHTMTYSWLGEWDKNILEDYKDGNLKSVVNHRHKEVEIQPEITDIFTGENGELVVSARTNNAGNTVSPFLIFCSLLDVSLEEVRLLNIVKKESLYDPR